MHQLRITRRTALGIIAAAATHPTICRSQTSPGTTARPRFHITPPYGRVNDPQRPLWWNNTWNLWLLWNNNYPTDSGGTEWRHYTSADLVNWSDAGVSIPKGTVTHDGGLNYGDVWTGSAVVDTSGSAGHGQNAIVAIMTMPNDDANGVQHQSQALWYTSSLDQQFSFDRIVMPNFGPPDFRDPSVRWSEGGNCWMATVSESNQISVYTSPDLVNWSYASHILPSGWNSGMGTPECSSLTRLHLYNPDGTTSTDKWVLACGLNRGGSFGLCTYFWTGDFDETNGRFTFTPDSPDGQWMDGGADFYAATIFQDGGVLDYAYAIAWNNNWAYAGDEPYNGYNGQASITRRLQLQLVNATPSLIASPLPALDALFSSANYGGDQTISDNQPYAWPVQPSTFASRIEFTMSPVDGAWPGAIYLSVRGDAQYFTQIGFEPSNGRAYTWRALSNSSGNMPGNAAWTDYRYAPCDFSGDVHILVYVDSCSVEVFLNDGRTTMSTIITTPPSATGLNLTTSGGSVRVYNLSVNTPS